MSKTKRILVAQNLFLFLLTLSVVQWSSMLHCECRDERFDSFLVDTDKPMHVLDKALSFLAPLGESSNDIALVLKFDGIKGTKNHPENCPLSVYLFYKFEKVEKFRVSGSHLICRGDKYCLPLQFQEFVDDFDQGKYPYLEREKEDESNR